MTSQVNFSYQKLDQETWLCWTHWDELKDNIATILYHIISYFIILDHFAPLWTILDHLDNFRPTLVILDQFKQFLAILDH